MIADYLEERGPQILSQTTLDLAVRNLLGFWGGKPLSYITEGTCNAYYAHRNAQWRRRQLKWNEKHEKTHEIKDISSGAVGRELRQLRAMVNRDFDMGRIISKPKIWIRPESYKKPTIPSRKEVILEARKAKPGSCRRKYILISFYTGARKGAVLSLRWPQVLPYHINFNESGSQSNKKKAIVPMNRKLKVYMNIWKKRGTDLGPVIHVNQRPVKNIKNAPKSLRHAAAVQMLISGIPAYEVSKVLGNTVEMIENHYGHLIPGHLEKAVEALA